MKNENVDI